jgi:glutathione synthase/RimK-type ligase-like ATP-grasp enzyme
LWSRRSLWTYYKYLKLETSYIITPSKKISILSGDKYETYLFCRSHQPKTFLLSTFLNKRKDQESLEKVVIKPIRANWWKGIELTTIQDLHINKDRFKWLEELYIVQDFKDFSGWCPWIVEWTHDIRLMFAGSAIIEATLRRPKAWSFKSNIWDWWNQQALAIDILPTALINLSKTIYQELQLQWDDIMSMDFAFCKKEDRRYLIEINASPWTRYYQTDTWEVTKICKWLIDFFTSLH